MTLTLPGAGPGAGPADTIADGARAPQPRLTRLDVQGFKSFAAKTTIVFEAGITAIVGPNGSGKSNVADAVRWVLGETGQAALRARRGEDVIFAGGQGRAPAGMAEATLTFDNSEGWLPIAFSEVTVSRRLFRSGESQFLINGRRVRLKDIALLTASLGQSHVVVGQGLVDAALSQKAEDRRALFEHAADLTGIRLKVAEAERNLAESEANQERLLDLLTELEPRLRRLERSARQAGEWQDLRRQLTEALIGQFRRALTAAQAQLVTAGTIVDGAEAALSDRQTALAGATAAAADARRRESAARAALNAHEASAIELATALRAAEHELALAKERAEAMIRRADDMRDTRQSLVDRQTSIAARLSELENSAAAGRSELETARIEAATARQTQQLRQRALTGLSQAREQLTRNRTTAERGIADATRVQADLAQRVATAAAARDRAAAEEASRQERRAALLADLAVTTQAISRNEADLAATAVTLRDLGQAITAAESAVAATAAEITAAERELTQARARQEALTKLQESGAGLHAGVRAVLRAGAAGQLSGVRGAVASLIEAPAGLETALEVALGGHLQDIVVDRWADAEAAIGFLKRSQSGRATFQPLDTVRRGRGPDQRVTPALRLAGVRGIAADLVSFDQSFQDVVDALLGRTLVVDDLPAARATLPHLPLGWSTVTITGEIARSGGAVTGGVAVKESGVLVRERELRDLPALLVTLKQRYAAALAARETAAGRVATLAQQRATHQAATATLTATLKADQRQHERISGWLAALDREEAAATSTIVAADDDSAGAALALAAQAELDGRVALAAAEDALSQHDIDWQEANAAATVATREGITAEQRLAGVSDRLAGEQRRRQELDRERAAVTAELEQRDQRLANVEHEHAHLTGQLTNLEAAVAGRGTALTDARAARGPLAVAANAAGSERTAADHSVSAAQERLLVAERERSAAQLGRARAEDQLAAVQAQAAQELEPDDLARLPAIAADDESVASVVDDAEAVAAREASIGRLRERLRRIGYVGDDVVAEYEREAEHHRFVKQQLADVDGAATALRSLLNELRDAMRSKFEETFSRVAAEFSGNFTELFGGGTAQLILAGADADGAEAGVDIVAQPPGKRLQSLALLSGGERALTGVALLFAILRVNPAPFCLLDEVDAALDEANVVRFRDQLARLTSQTQVIVVTHNRGTIEIANTLYGVSMGADGASRLLSLRLDDVPAEA